MRRKIAYVLAFVLIVAFTVSFGGTALADDSISTTVKVSPSSLPGPGTVSVTVTIKNNEDPITNVVLKYPSPTDSEISMGNLATGATQEHSNPTWNITDDMLNEPLAFTVFWTSVDGTQKSGNTDSFTIARQEQKIEVSGSANATPKEVNKGDMVKYTFSLTNQGNVKIDNAYLTAPPLKDGERIGNDFELDPGGTKEITYEIPMNESADVKPTFTYAVGGKQYTYDMNDIQIAVNDTQTASMSVTADVDTTSVDAGGTVTFNLYVKNNGTAEISNIAAKDSGGNPVTVSPTSLQPGETATGTSTQVVNQAGNYAFMVTAQDADGTELTTQSNSVPITIKEAEPSPTPEPTQSVDTARAIKVGVSFSSVKGDNGAYIVQQGTLPMTLEVDNLTDQELSNIVVSEVNHLGTLGTLSVLPGGEKSTFEKDVDMEESGQYTFKVVGQLPDGTEVSSQTDPITITVEAPETENNNWLLGLTVVLVAIAAVGIALGVYIYKHRKKANASKNPQQGQSQRAQRQQRPPQVSPSGRQRPQRYGAEREQGDGPPIHEYQERPRQQRVETVEPKARTAPKPKNASGTKYGDRNKF